MARRDDIVDFARELLDLDSYHDYGPMGVQVVGAEEVSKIAASVSSSRAAFEQAQEVGAQLREPASLDGLAERLAEVTGREPQVFDGGPERIERVAIVTGGGAKLIRDAAAAGYHAYVTGEPAEPTLHLARELGIHFLAGGHYATETFGIKALAEKLAERFSLEWEFLDLPV